jgi:hypothetical protein
VRHLRVQKLSVEEPGARDEGPRLIPIKDEAHDILKGYAELGDIALGRTPNKKQE